MIKVWGRTWFGARLSRCLIFILMRGEEGVTENPTQRLVGDGCRKRRKLRTNARPRRCLLPAHTQGCFLLREITVGQKTVWNVSGSRQDGLDHLGTFQSGGI